MTNLNFTPESYAAYVAAVAKASQDAHEDSKEMVAYHGTRRADFSQITAREAEAHGKAHALLVPA